MRVIENLIKFMEFKGLNDNEVTTQCGLGIGVIGKAKKGRNDIGKKSIDRILANYPELNRTWLLTGEGNMIVGDVNGNNAIGNANSVVVNESSTIEKLIAEMAAQREAHERETSQLLEIIKNLTNK